MSYMILNLMMKVVFGIGNDDENDQHEFVSSDLFRRLESVGGS